MPKADKAVPWRPHWLFMKLSAWAIVWGGEVSYYIKIQKYHNRTRDYESMVK